MDGNRRNTPPTRLPVRSWRWVRWVGRLHWVEVVTALAAVALAAWQIVAVDPEMALPAVISVLLPVAAIVIQARFPGNGGTVVHVWSIAYLVLLCVGALIASRPDWLPHFQAISRKSDGWNQLELSTRRMFAWNGWLALTSVFFLSGTGFWRSLRRRLAGEESDLSIGTCLLALFTFWGLPLFTLVGMGIEIFLP